MSKSFPFKTWRPPRLETAEAVEAVGAVVSAGAPPTITTITLAPESGASSIEAMPASDSAVERPDITIVHASTSTPNTSNILNQDTAEFSPANNQEAADQDPDSTVESNPMNEEVYRRPRSEEIMEGRPRYPLPANHPRQDPTEIDYRLILVNLMSHARLLAEMNWDWRSDVASIDREEALENLATLYDGLIAKYDHLVLAYNVLVQMYGVSGLTEDGIDATGPNDGPIQAAQEDLDEQINASQPPPPLLKGCVDSERNVALTKLSLG
jgi:hypothetical protein